MDGVPVKIIEGENAKMSGDEKDSALGGEKSVQIGRGSKKDVSLL